MPAILSLDPDSGETHTDEDENPQLLNSGILVRREEVEYLDFTETAAEEQDLMKGKRRKAQRRAYSGSGGYTTDKVVVLSKLPKGPGPGASKSPKNSKSK